MTVTPTPAITALDGVTPPNRQTMGAAAYVVAADAMMGALPTLADQLEATAEAAEANAEAAEAAAVTAEAAAVNAVSATGYLATSATSLAVGTGSKVFTTQAGKSFAASGDRVTAFSASTPTARMRGTATYSGTTLTMTADEVEGSGTYADWVLVMTGLENRTAAGRQAIWIPAAAMTPRSTNGAAFGTVETTTNKVMLKTLDFDASTIEYAQFAIRMPKAWDEGPVSAVFEWSHAAAATNFKVSWGLQAVALSDDDAADAAFGTAQYANDTGGTTNDVYASPECTAITVAGSPAAEDLVIFQTLRKADDGTNDTLAIDARLHGVTIYVTTAAENDA